MSLRILDSTVLQLHSDVNPTENGIHDRATDRVIRANPVARTVLSRMSAGPCTPHDLVEHISAEYDQPAARVRPDISLLLTQLDRSALLVTQTKARSWLAHVWSLLRNGPHAVAVIWYSLMSSEQRPVGKRFTASTRGVFAATLTANTPFILGATVVTILLNLVVVATSSSPLVVEQVRSYSLATVVLLASYLLIGVAHEVGHLLASRLMDAQLYFIVARGFRVSVVRAPAPKPTHERLIAAVGPLAAALVGIGLSAALWALDDWRMIWFPLVMVTFPMILGLTHVVSVLPWSTDGRQLWGSNLFGRRRSTPESEPTLD